MNADYLHDYDGPPPRGCGYLLVVALVAVGWLFLKVSMSAMARYVVEDGAARGYWVVDSWSRSDAAKRRFVKWIWKRDSATEFAAAMNRVNVETMAR